jgi:hypothetical protein
MREQRMAFRSLGQHISAFLERIKPYRELVAWGVAVVIAISTGVSSAVNYFATQSQVRELDCRIARNVAIQLIPLQTETIGVKIDWRTAEIEQMAKEKNESNEKRLSDMVKDINALTQSQAKLASEIKERIDKAAEECNK